MYVEVFNIIRDALVKSQYHTDMVMTREDSPYHRENSVWEHTQMTLRWYRDNLANTRTEQQQFLTKTALLFHDTGKPSCRELKNHPERGMVYRYPAHELRSARIFEDFIISNDFFKLMTPQEFRQIKWLIEHHLPYDFSKPNQLAGLKVDIISQSPTLMPAFIDMVLSDAYGRISDEHSDKLQRTWSWAESFVNAELPTLTKAVDENKELWILVGASGSGKSTFRSAHDSFATVNLDQYRLDYYFSMTGNSEYDVAWQYCVDNESAFDKFWKADYTAKIKSGKSIIVDNTNGSKKRRRYFIALARDHGYVIRSVEFPNALSTLIQRQSTRSDKTVSNSSVAQQYYATSSPAIGTEVDAAYLIDSNSQLHALGKVDSYYDFNSIRKSK